MTTTQPAMQAVGDETYIPYKNEGQTKTIVKTLVRHDCSACGEPATRQHTFLLENARTNPASSAYRHDDCSWCSDEKVFTCTTCKPETPDGMHWCSTFFGERFPHLMLYWVEKEVKDADRQREVIAQLVANIDQALGYYGEGTAGDEIDQGIVRGLREARSKAKDLL